MITEFYVTDLKNLYTLLSGTSLNSSTNFKKQLNTYYNRRIEPNIEFVQDYKYNY